MMEDPHYNTHTLNSIGEENNKQYISSKKEVHESINSEGSVSE